jgi:hypothetical protein
MSVIQLRDKDRPGEQETAGSAMKKLGPPLLVFENIGDFGN